MATRSAIGYKIEDGSIVGTYCHWDGYISNNGDILAKHYTSLPKIIDLIAGGEMSSLGEEIGTKHSFDVYSLTMEEKAKFEKMTTYYGRDRDEVGTGPRTFPSVEVFLDYFAGMGCEFFYLYEKGEWTVSQYRRPFENLNAILAEENV